MNWKVVYKSSDVTINKASYKSTAFTWAISFTYIYSAWTQCVNNYLCSKLDNLAVTGASLTVWNIGSNDHVFNKARILGLGYI